MLMCFFGDAVQPNGFFKDLILSHNKPLEVLSFPWVKMHDEFIRKKQNKNTPFCSYVCAFVMMMKSNVLFRIFIISSFKSHGMISLDRHVFCLIFSFNSLTFRAGRRHFFLFLKKRNSLLVQGAVWLDCHYF